MRISDWISDVCSSDLGEERSSAAVAAAPLGQEDRDRGRGHQCEHARGVRPGLAVDARAEGDGDDGCDHGPNHNQRAGEREAVGRGTRGTVRVDTGCPTSTKTNKTHTQTTKINK